MPNPNLSSGQVVPGFFGYVDYDAQGAGSGPDNRCLLFGYISGSAQRTPNQPFLPASQQEADDGAGRGSDLANWYAAAVSQPEAQGAEIWLLPLPAPTGTAATYKLTILGSPTKAGVIQLWIRSQKAPAVSFATTDTQSTIGTALAAAIASMKDLQVTSAISVSGVITITYLHTGTTGEDFPIRGNITPTGSGINLSLGSLVFATNATGAGSVKVSFGALSVSTALAGAETPAQIATKVVASFNADTYPMTAQIGGTSSTVDLLMANDYDVRRISASIITTTGTTVTLTGGSATDGTGSASSFTYNGAQGVGAPVLTSALTNLVARDSYRSWAAPWMDAATVGTLATSIELQSNGSLTGQKQQILTLCGYSAASVDGALAPACSPDLTQTGPRYAILNAQDVPVAGMEIAARVAAARAGTWIDKPNKNWNGFKIQGSVRAPILLPPSKTSILAQNQALVTYALAPVVRGKSGYMEIVKGRSTSLAVDKRLWAWSSESQAAFHILDLHNRYAERFSEASLVRFSEPKAPGLFDSGAVEFATIEAMKAWELAGHYDGADILAPAVKTTIDPNNPFRFNTEFPESPVLDLDQIVFTSHFSSPGQ